MGSDNSKKTVTINLGAPLLGLLGVILCTLKALGLTGMTWMQATLPFWIGLAFFIGFLLLIGLGALVLFITMLIIEGLSMYRREQLRKKLRKQQNKL